MSFINELQPIVRPETAAHPPHQIDHRTSLVLCLLALLSYLIQFATNVLLARNLSQIDFEDYNLAMAIVLTMSTVATLGFEKLALYLLPVFRERKDWNRSRGFLRSARRSVITVSVALTLIMILSIETILSWLHEDEHFGMVLLIGSLPVLSYGIFLVDALTAYGRQILATFLYRIVMPSLLLALTLTWIQWHPSHSSLLAPLAFFVAWAITTGLLSRYFRKSRPTEVLTASPHTEWSKWLSRAWPFSFYSLMLTAQGQSGVLALTLLYHTDPVVSEYAMAFNVGTFILLIATATNRFYLPALAVHLERHDARSFHHDIRMRRLWVAILVVTFVVAINFSGDVILGLFGVDFVRGYPALVVISTGTAVAVIFAPAPYVLQFLGYDRHVLYISLLALLATIAGSIYFGSQYGSLGVASSFAASLTAQFFLLKLVMHSAVHRHFAEPMKEANRSESD